MGRSAGPVLVPLAVALLVTGCGARPSGDAPSTAAPATSAPTSSSVPPTPTPGGGTDSQLSFVHVVCPPGIP